MENTMPKKEKRKSEHKKKSKKKIVEPSDPQISMAKHQAEILKQNSERLSSPSDLAMDGGENDRRALKLRLDLNLDAEINLKAKINGSVTLTLL